MQYSLPNQQEVTFSDEDSDESLPSSDETSVDSDESSDETIEQGLRRSWAPIEEHLNTLLDFCQGEWRTLSEIASALNRKENTVRTVYMPQLLKQGKLIRRHTNPHHPMQAYRTQANQPDGREQGDTVS